MGTLYRVHHKLLVDSQRGRYIETGCVHSLGMIKQETIGILLAQKTISIVQAPPLDTFTGWGGRARKLDELGIDTIGFITMGPQDVAYAIKASTRKEGVEQEIFDERVDKLAVAVARWQHEIKEALGIGDATGRN